MIDIKSFVDGETLVESEFLANIDSYDWSRYQDQAVLIRGCSDIIIPTWAYMSVTARLAGIARSIRYGNEHSNLVIHRKARTRTPETP